MGRAQTPAQTPTLPPLDAKIVPVQVTGDDASRFTMVVMADGYTAADMPQFRRDLDKHLNIQWSLEPFRSYRNYFNVYAVEAVSQDSGLACDPMLLQETNMDPALRKQLQQRNTAFGLSFGGGCTNVNARGVTPTGNMNARIREYAAKATPNPDQILIIGNSRSYGGIGGGIATSTGSNSLSPLITPHEIGHSLGRLTDEYTYGARGVAGGTYKGAEPNSVHTTLLTVDEMKAQQKKWWRWLGEPSESGGLIDRFEGGSGDTKGIWRPSKHSMMISLGYFFDQVSLEQMVRQISARVGLIAASTPTDQPVFARDVIWIRPARPVYHELKIEWSIDDKPIPNPKNLPYLDLSPLVPASRDASNPQPDRKVTVRVVDPTEFVRDPAIRDAVLTATRTWTVNASAIMTSDLRFIMGLGTGTLTTRPVGATDVVYVESAGSLDRSHMSLIGPAGIRAAPSVEWRIDNVPVADAAGRPSIALASQKLAPGTHTLTVAVGSAADQKNNPQGTTRRWTIDNTMPTVTYALSKSIATLTAAAGAEPHTFMRDEFTMKLDPKDDQPGYVVAEFRLNGDGWHHYYGWPDAPPGTPFKFTARGTNIKELIYGSLSSEGLSPQPWEAREPGWGSHRIEYRAKDAAGNIGPAKAFRVTVMPLSKCTTTITGTRLSGPIRAEGVTCLDNAVVGDSIIVNEGATLIATNSKISGSVSATTAATIELVNTSIDGRLKLVGTTDRLALFGITVGQDADVSDSKAATAPLVIGSTFKAALNCTGNTVPVANGGSPNVSARGVCK